MQSLKVWHPDILEFIELYPDPMLIGVGVLDARLFEDRSGEGMGAIEFQGCGELVEDFEVSAGGHSILSATPATPAPE